MPGSHPTHPASSWRRLGAVAFMGCTYFNGASLGSWHNLRVIHRATRMTLSVGTRLGPYEIAAEIGAGGMGVVYRARDTKLGRDVALKILPDAFALDPDRVARFKREAQVLASLNHPNIAAIYGLEEGPAEAGPHERTEVRGRLLPARTYRSRGRL